MRLVTAKVGPFRSINAEQEVRIEPDVTALVGMNESGKTVFLFALQKCADAYGAAIFAPIDDYPRKSLTTYLTRHKTAAEVAATLTFEISDSEAKEISQKVGFLVHAGMTLTVGHKYDNSVLVGLSLDRKKALSDLITAADLSDIARQALAGVTDLESVPAALASVQLEARDNTWLEVVKVDIATALEPKWEPLKYKLWLELRARTPRFLYFGDYDVLPSKINILDLLERTKDKADQTKLSAEHRGVLALLAMADISPADFSNATSYEELKAKLEAVSISLTDQIMEFWKQNEELDVEIDIKPDPTDVDPYNNGPNLYLRIKNQRHRGVSTPFKSRSRGFTWFFSFLVWFDDIRTQMAKDPGPSRSLILLLDEPGVSLHALAQADFLRYIDDLGTRHQVLYTTHSPFMIKSDALQRVRTVEDQKTVGTVISSNLEAAKDLRTIFPLQAALGWSLSQSLFIGQRNIIVEGPSELLYLRAVSALLSSGSLRPDAVIVPCGGLDKISTFVALFGANNLNLAVLHDYKGKPDQRLAELVREKLIAGKKVLDASMFRDASTKGKSTGLASDIEDLFEPAEYIGWFNATFVDRLLVPAELAKLPVGDRIVDRLTKWLAAEGILLRPSGGYNHYLVALHHTSTSAQSTSTAARERFAVLFARVNELLE